MYELSYKIKKCREAKGLSKAELARLIHVSSASVSYYESGTKNPSTETLISLAIALGVSLDYLVGIDKHRSIIVEGLTERQIETVTSLVTEFYEHHFVPGLSPRQQSILNNILLEFNTNK